LAVRNRGREVAAPLRHYRDAATTWAMERSRARFR
jgi:hypothetical protein